MSSSKERWITAGIIGSPHGLNGRVRLFSFLQVWSDLASYSEIFRSSSEGRFIPLPFESMAKQGKFFLAKIEGVETRQEAVFYRNVKLFLPYRSLPVLGLNEYYWTDLSGLSVLNTAGINIGKVTEILRSGGNDILVIERSSGRILLPFLFPFPIKSVSLERREICVEWHGYVDDSEYSVISSNELMPN